MISFVDFPVQEFVINLPVQVVSSYDKPNLIQRLINKILIYLGRHPKYKISADRLKDLRNDEIIIVFDTLKNYSEVCKYIEQIASDTTKLILYLWNPVSHSKDFEKLSDKWIISSFSKEDSEKYGFKFVDTFYNPYLIDSSAYTHKSNDIFFIGTDKGRIKKLMGIQDILKKQEITYDFRIVDNLKRRFDSRYTMGIKYSEVCQIICKSKALLEITQTNQNAPTLRTMEALFFKKKLITNNVKIKNYSFYCKENIFILGEDPIENIKDFINSNYIELPKEIIDYYSFERWLLRISR